MREDGRKEKGGRSKDKEERGKACASRIEVGGRRAEKRK
jgi:hypothetical protein